MTVIHRPDIADMMAAFVDRWAPGCERSKFAEELKDVVRFEMERCAFAAADACLEQDEAGHPHNQNTWMAACSYIKSKIMSVKPEWMTTPADIIREDAIKATRERCARIADQWAIASSDAEQIAAAIRSSE